MIELNCKVVKKGGNTSPPSHFYINPPLWWVCSVVLYGSDNSPVQGEDVNRLQRKDSRMVWWMWNVKSQDRNSAEELRTRLKLKIMRKCLQDRQPQWFGHLIVWSKNVRVLSWEKPRKTWNDKIRSDLQKGEAARK